jgi:hypothetical protein
MAETLPAEKIGEIATEQQQSTAVNGESAAADLPANSTNVDANGEAGKANKVQEVVKEPPKNPQEGMI